MRQLLVYGDKTFKIAVPDGAKVTFGPFSPPTKGNPYNEREKAGTLRIYQGSKDNIVACFAGVHGFRDLSLDYAEEVAKEEGATIWNSDKDGYRREEKASSTKEWISDPGPLLPGPVTKGKRR